MRTVALSDGKRVPVLGQGTWRMGEREMYGDGGAEEIAAETIHGQHQDVCVVTKVYLHNA